jgi:hypothetical protein
MHTMRNHRDTLARAGRTLSTLILVTGAALVILVSPVGAVAHHSVQAMNTCSPLTAHQASDGTPLVIGPNAPGTWNAIVGEDLEVTLRSGCSPASTVTDHPSGVVRILSTTRTRAGIVALHVQAIRQGTTMLTVTGSDQSLIILWVTVHRAAATVASAPNLGRVPTAYFSKFLGGAGTFAPVTQHLRTPISAADALQIAQAHVDWTGYPDGISLATNTVETLVSPTMPGSATSTLAFVISYHLTAVPPAAGGGPAPTPGMPSTTQPSVPRTYTVTFAVIEIDAITGAVLGAGDGVTSS